MLIQALQTLSTFLGDGGLVYVRRFHERGALQRLIANFVASEFTLDDLLRPFDVNLPGWTVKLLSNIVAPDFEMARDIRWPEYPGWPTLR